MKPDPARNHVVRGSKLEDLYKTEADPNVKERLLLLVLKAKEGDDEMILASIAKELHRSRHGLQTGLPDTKKKV